MANTERRGNGEAGSRGGSESSERVAIATDEGLQAERLCGEERGLSARPGIETQACRLSDRRQRRRGEDDRHGHTGGVVRKHRLHR